MAAKKVGELIREARTAAGLTQEKLGAAVGLAASDISKAERGELDLTDAALKKIAKATGVTQASLLNAPKGGMKATAAKTTTAAKKTTATKPAATTKAAASTKTAAAKKTTAAKAATPANANVSMKVTSTEQKLIEYYRTASSDAKKAATRILKGECNDMITGILGSSASSVTNSVTSSVVDIIGDALGSILGGK